MIDEIAYLIGGAAAGFLINAVFGPRRVVVDVKAVDVQADRVAVQPGDHAWPAIWKTETVTKPAKMSRNPGAKVKAKA